MDGAERRRGALYACLLIGLFGLYFLGLLIGPRIPDAVQSEYCVSNFRIISIFGHSLQCDSGQFILDAAEPSGLLATDSVRQGRPGSAFAVHVISWPLERAYRAIVGRNFRIERTPDPARRIKEELRRFPNPTRFLPYYAGFLIFHALTLAGSFLLYLYAIGRWPLRLVDFGLASVWAGALLIINNVTQIHFFSPHTQMFNIFAPVSAIAGARLLVGAQNRTRNYLIVAVAMGVLLLFYAVVAVAVTVVGLAYLILELGEKGFRLRVLARLVVVNFVAIALFGACYLAWYGYVVSVNGAFFQYDIVEFDGFGWIARTYLLGGALGVIFEALERTGRMLEFCWRLGWGFWIIALALGLVVLRGSAGALRSSGHERVVILAALTFTFLVSAFFGVYGLIGFRVANAALVPVFVLIGLFLHRLEGRSPGPGLLALTIAGLVPYAVWVAVKFGPYS